MAKKLAQYGMFPISILDDDRLKGNEKLVFIVLCRHFNIELEKAWPSIPLLMKETGLGRQTVITCIKALCDAGVIEKSGGNGKVSEYKIPSFFVDFEPVQISDQSKNWTAPVQNLDYHQSKNWTAPVQKLDPNIHINNLLEQHNEHTYIEHVQDLVLAVKPKRKRQTKNSAFDAEFEQLYEIYPYSPHNDKAQGKKNFVKLRANGVNFEELMQAVSNYAESVKETEAQFIKGVNNFLSSRSGFWQNFKLQKTAKGNKRQEINKTSLVEYMNDMNKAGLIWSDDDHDS